MIQQRSRIPAVMMLLALMAFGVGMIFARRGAGNVAQQSQIDDLRKACASANATPKTWKDYGDALLSVKNFREAAVAYDQVLKADPYQRDCRVACAKCRAILGQPFLGDTKKDQDGLVDNFARFMDDTIKVDPKTAKAIFENQPEAASYLALAKFQELKKAADAGSMD